VAVLCSFATAVYGENIVEMRRHYSHSISVMVVFAVWHHIYFTGALSMNWPNVLVSFWSNYAWTGGMVYFEHMQNIINDFIGSNKGNTSHVGAAGTGVNNPGLGGGYNIQQSTSETWMIQLEDSRTPDNQSSQVFLYPGTSLDLPEHLRKNGYQHRMRS
jgi:hypothetical protein